MSCDKEHEYVKENKSENALQYAARNGDLEKVRYYIENGYCIDAGSETALHLALKNGHTSVALFLLQAGADFDLRDKNGDCAIHIAARDGLLAVTQALCTLGCSVEVPNAKGLYPLHLAARNGHIHIVRCLCCAGCNIECRNADGIRADITALKFGHNDIAEILDRLRNGGQRDVYSRQLVPTTKPVTRLALRLFGHCGVGKTSLIKSLSAGLFSSLFRRSGSLQSNKSRPSSPVNTQIEMDVTSRQNSLTFDTVTNYQSTKGVSVQHLDVSNVGEVILFEFSGAECYFGTYHLFLNLQTNNRFNYPRTIGIPCVTAVLFNLEDTLSTQLRQCCFWLNFLLSRITPADYPGCGKVILLATHVDSGRAAKTAQGEWLSPDAQIILADVQKQFGHAFDIHPNVIVMDCNVPASHAFKQLRAYLNGIKQCNFQYFHGSEIYRSCCTEQSGTYYSLLTSDASLQNSVGSWTGLLEQTLIWLNQLKRDNEHYPVLTRDDFSSLLRSQVNLLASDDHINELLIQLHSIGEVFCIEHFIVMSLPWLGTELLGELMSTQFLANARITGVYTVEDFQSTFAQCDASKLLQLLEALQLCIQCEVDEEVEYEFPYLNFVETIPGLWDASDPRYQETNACYGGYRLKTPVGTSHLLNSIFPQVQIELRRATFQVINNKEFESELDLYQWFHGSKLCAGLLECMITLEDDDISNSSPEYIEVKVRGPSESARECFIFIDEIIAIINNTLMIICPGLIIERHVLSTDQLKSHSTEIHCWPPDVINAAILEAESCEDVTLTNPITEKSESIVDLVMFGCSTLSTILQWSCSLSCRDLHPAVVLRLAGLLDPPDPLGRDWCVLALRMGLPQSVIANLHTRVQGSSTHKLIANADCTIGCLISSLRELGRQDGADVILRSVILFQLVLNTTDTYLQSP
ncbi:death-associated protein kinase 1-like isoform X2 [Chrysoperla carnea]|uniref:death-associated protein kinase 1-like isoform X2 n=1 Tax=Chrysoperla carnea TaxID=189513 RepID=UPI001D065A5F|nr:death-associated protein kinase 1-like isoform X2 [Chrysoperla carnea]